MKPPRVTVGLPVYNGIAHIDESLACLHAQTWPNLEILIGDNASTDGTREVIESWVRRDKRMTLIARPENIGSLNNFRDLLSRADGELFLWRAFDDLSDPDYIQSLALALIANPQAGLAAPDVLMTRMSNGKQRRRPLPAHLPPAGPARTRALIRGAEAGWFYGLHRKDIVRPIIDEVLEFYPHDWGWDHLALFLIALRSDIAPCPSAHFHQRLSVGVKAYVRPASGRDYGRVAADYFDFCRKRLGGLPAVDRLLTEIAVLQQINRRVVRFQRIVKAAFGSRH